MRSSAKFLIGMVLLCGVAIVAAFWQPGEKELPQASPPEPKESSRFTYSNDSFSGRSSQLSEDQLLMERAAVSRQMNRLARMERDRVAEKIIDNPSMPDEIRWRFKREKERLEMLAEAHPEEAEQARVGVPRDKRFQEDGSVTPEFKEVLSMMKSSGAVHELSEAYVNQLKMDAEDPDTPASSRPTEKDIERARNELHIPLL